MELTISSLAELEEVAKKLVAFAGDRKIWLFTGEIGAGKTTLIQRICAFYGVDEKVTSPTYSLVNQYEGSNTKGLIYHLDLYRLNQLQEALDIGIEDFLYDGFLCLIEWPALIEPILPPEVVKINIEIVEDSKRKILFL